jgi:hypothetical protein
VAGCGQLFSVYLCSPDLWLGPKSGAAQFMRGARQEIAWVEKSPHSLRQKQDFKAIIIRYLFFFLP